MNKKMTRTHTGRATARHVGGRGVFAVALRLYIAGGGLVLTVVVFLVTGSLWSLALLLPWFVIAKIMQRLG